MAMTVTISPNFASTNSVPVEASSLIEENSIIYGNNEEYIFNFLVTEMGLNTAAACGVLANIEKESNFRSDLLEYGYTWNSGGGYGICQWTNYPRTASSGRRTNLVNYCNANGYDYTSLIGQLYFLKYELETTYYNSVYARLQQVSNTAEGAYNAGYRWCYSFEVPQNYSSVSIVRGNLAMNTYWEKYKSYSSCNCSDKYNGEYVVNSTGGNVTILAGHSITAYQIATIFNGSEVTVTQSDGIWAHVTYGDYQGICKLKDLQKLDGETYCYGDIDGDMELTSMDFLMLKKYILGTISLDENMMQSADLNNDGSVNATDYLLIKSALFMDVN